jgi:hypothetical protein
MKDGTISQSIIKYITYRFFNRLDNIKLLNLNKVFGKLNINQIIADIQKEIIENETKIKILREVRVHY